MGKIYDEFVDELREIELKYKDNPEKELDALLYIALQREELVATAYRATFIESNIDKLPLTDDLKTLIRHALIWIWKDEDMHTVYTRGALLKSQNLFHRINVFINQFNGYIGGWAGSIIQHLKWTEAPFSVSIAQSIIFFGNISGKISEGIRKELRFGSFKNFCNFNIDAEKTARICWERILLLSKTDARFSINNTDDFQKIIEDEWRHQQIFNLIYDSLNENDQLIAGITQEQLIDRIKNISHYFLPQAYRDPSSNFIGKGGIVWVAENKSATDKYDFFISELNKTELKNDLIEKARTLHKSIDQLSVVVKVTFSMGYDKIDKSPMNDPALVEKLAIYLSDLGIQTIVVTDIDSIYSSFFNNRSIGHLADYFGFRSNYYRVENASENLIQYNFSRGIGNYEISKTWKDADFRINFGKVRSHPIEMALLSINNLEWLTGNTSEFVFVDRIVDRFTTTSMLLEDFAPDYNIVEAYDHVPDGILGVMGSKMPIEPKRFYFGRDAIALDLVLAKHLQIHTLPQKSSLRNSIHWFGAENSKYEIVGEDSIIPQWKSPTKKMLWAFLSFLSSPVYVFLSNRGELFVPKMDSKEFTPKSKPGFFIAIFRHINRAMTNLPN